MLGTGRSLVPSVTHSDLYMIVFHIPIHHLHSACSFPWTQARSTLHEMLCSSCSWPRNWDFHLSTNDIEAFFFALDRLQKGPREQKPIVTCHGIFPVRTCIRSRSRCLSPCPDTAHEDPPVTYVPSPSRFAGSPDPLQPPSRKGNL